MTEHEKQEFWSSLARLYDETLAIKESIGELREPASDLLRIAQAHQRAVESHQRVAEAHDLDKLEVVQEWLAEKERAREQRPQA
jgi:hypothetical protein